VSARRSKAAPKLELPDIEGTAERLLTQVACAAPKLSWGGPVTSQADARRREVDRLLEAKGLKPRRW
jgi:hypothetical protein